jgi:hypothetical protein
MGEKACRKTALSKRRMYSLNPEPVAVEGKKIKKINVRDNDATGWISKKG